MRRGGGRLCGNSSTSDSPLQSSYSFDNMEYRKQTPRWILALVTVMAWFVGMAVPLTPDGLALLDFKTGLTVTSPLLMSWNAFNATPCSWGGITCTDGGRVRNVTLSAQVPMLEGNISASLGKLNLLEGLMLDQNLLSGSIPPELGNLRSLRVLVLSNNSLAGQIPPQLGNCSSLVQLHLDTNMLSGDIPDSLGNLRSLGSLNLCCNLLTGEISLDLQLSFAAMTNLSFFYISSNHFSGFGPPLAYKNLAMTTYAIDSNNFTGDITIVLDDLSKLPAINFIALEGNRFKGALPPSIGNAITLSRLSLGISENPGHQDTGFGGQIPKEIGNLRNLDTLYLGNNNFTGDIPLEFWNMTSMKYLDLGQTNMRGQIPPEVANMKSLIWLLLRDNKLNGTIPPSLGELVNLTWLELENNRITGTIPNSLILLTNLQTLDLGKNNMTGTIPINLSTSATSLQRFLLYNNSFFGSIPSDFGKFMPNLYEFAIGHNFFHGMLPNGLCNSGKLEWLTIGGNNLEGPIPQSLAKCKSLMHVGFANNQFTSIPNGFGSNSTLQYLDCSHNQITGELPLSLGVNSQLTYLDLSDNSFTGAISLLEFPQLAQNLSILNLARNSFTGEIPPTIALCKMLFLVDLSYNFLTGTVPLALANLSSLQELHLQGNNLTLFHPNTYSTLSSKLHILNLAKNPWNVPIAVEIGSLKGLQNLNLSYGGYTGPIPSSLGQLTQLEVLDLSHNNLIGEVPIELGDLMTSLISVNVAFNRLSGSLPPAWVKFLLANPASFQGNPSLCLQYDIKSMCVSMPSKANARSKHKLAVRVIVSVILGSILGLALVIGLVVYISSHFQKQGPMQEEMPVESIAEKEELEISNLTSEPWMFTYDEIMKATEGLNNKYVIGKGGHGTVYKVECLLGTRPSIAVKKVEFKDKNTQVLLHKSFWSEVKSVGKVRHRNLVRLLGFIKRDEIGLLLYDYMSNGDLYSALHKIKLGHQMYLDWKARLHIARGVAHGLAYLHHDYGIPIVHRDIKSSNVLLDGDLEAHISDFGLAKMLDVQRSKSIPWISTHNVCGTLGYIAPEAAFGVMATPQVDVYSFGVLLLELLTGKEAANDPIYGSQDSHIVAWVKKVVELNKGKVSEFVLDPSLLQSKNLVAIDEMIFVLEVALLCTMLKPEQRPTMRSIENMLETLSHIPEKVVENVKENGVETKNNNWHTLQKTFGNAKENKVETKSNNTHNDCLGRNIENILNMTMSSEGSDKHESFWSDKGIQLYKDEV